MKGKGIFTPILKMKISDLPHVTPPLTLTPNKPKGATPITEKFSSAYEDKLYSNLLREFCGTLAYMYQESKSKAVIDSSIREITTFCEFLTVNDNGQNIKSLTDLTTDLLEHYLLYMQRKFPTHTDRNGNTKYPWYAKYKMIQTRLSPFLPQNTFPYVKEPDTQPTEAHTPLAFNMIIKSCLTEIDRIRGKIGKWEEIVNNSKGRCLDLEWFEKNVAGKTRTGLTKEQIEKIEELIFITYPDPLSREEEAEQLRLDYEYFRQVRYRWKKKGREEGRPKPRIELSEQKIDEIDELIFVTNPDVPSLHEQAEQLGFSYNYYKQIRNIWKKKGREEGRPLPQFTIDDDDLTIEDICKTINHYLPDWPVFGAPLAGKDFRVYKYEQGPFVSEYDTKEEAANAANKINGFVRKRSERLASPRGLNPAEMLFYYRGQTEGNIATALSKLLPNGFHKDIKDKFFGTTYDWTVILIHWLCLTGWNLEAVRSVPLSQLLRMFKGNGPEDLMSKEHTIFSTEIKPDKEEQKFEKSHAAITGLKTRSQPINKGKLYTHISDRNEEYGLVRVLADYYKLTKTLNKKYLQGDQCNCILVGVTEKDTKTSSPLTLFGPSTEVTDLERQMENFFKKHEIYEEEGQCGRVYKTSPRKLRSSFFTKLQHMGVPITTQMFLGRWSSIDTLMLSYAGDESSITLVRAKARKLLNEVEDMAFKGILPEYTQFKNDENGKAVIQIIDWQGLDVTVCKNPWNPTWEGNIKWLDRDGKGKLLKHCTFSDMCLFCKQCEIRPESLKFLIQWDKDIRDWAKKVSVMNFPEYLPRRQDAIREIFMMCEADPDWKMRLEEAEEEVMEPNFTAPPIWSSLRR